MKKKVILLPIFALLLAGCNGQGGSSSGGGGISLPSSDTSVSVPTSEGSSEEMPSVVAIKDVSEYVSGTVMTVGGKVTKIYQDSLTNGTMSVSIQDGADALLLYAVSTTVLGAVKVGDSVEASGTYSPYYGIDEINPVTELNVVSTSYSVETFEITTWTNETLLTMDSRLVSINGATPFADSQTVNINDHTDYYVTFDNKQVDLRLNKNLGPDELTAIAAKLDNLRPNIDTIDVVGIIGSYQNNAQFSLVSADDIVVHEGVVGGAVTGVTLATDGNSSKVATVEQYRTLQLVTGIQPANAANQVATYASSNEAAATVSATGLVTTIAPGEATITVTTDDGGFTDSVVITVTATTQTVLAPAAVHELATGVAAVVKGTVTSTPSNGSFSIQSGNSGLYLYNVPAAMRSSFVVGHEVVVSGTTSIYKDFMELASITVVVDLGVSAETINPLVISTMGALTAADAGRIVTVTGLAYVSGSVTVGTSSSINFTLGSESVVVRTDKYLDDTVEQAIADVIAGLTPVDTVDFAGVLGWYTPSPQLLLGAVAELTVHKGELTPATSVVVSAADGVTSVEVAGTLQLAAEVLPNSVGDGFADQTVTWSSSDGAKATVDAEGLVTGVAEGAVTITATSSTAGIVGTIDLTVIAAVAKTTLTITASDLALSATYADGTATVNGLSIAFTQLYLSSNGFIQMRYKNEIQSGFFNDVASELAIVKITVNYDQAQTNLTELDLYAGSESVATATEGATKVCNVAGQYSYDVNFEATENIHFFKLEKPQASYTAYVESVVLTFAVVD
ncbi:MAG TPA: Ig-like domain-containing protein [Bacilli bacterium]|nr:Ig-like domain-containing protein [Bacilli bacterium]